MSIAKNITQKWADERAGLSNELGRDYKNVHTDLWRLQQIGLIVRTKDAAIEVPWDIVEARLRLAA